MTTRDRHFRFPWGSCPWVWHENRCSLAHLHGCSSPFRPFLHQDILCSACSPVPSTGQMWSLYSGACLCSCGRDVLTRDWLWSSANRSLKPGGREGRSADERVSRPTLQRTASYRWPSNSQDHLLLRRRENWTSDSAGDAVNGIYYRVVLCTWLLNKSNTGEKPALNPGRNLK